ncbi:MAG: TPM domain-containing protein, partial [Nitrospiraceae bacterium]
STLFEKWGIGTAQEEHGVLVLLAVEERQAAVSVGRPMLPVVTPEIVSKIGREYLEPVLKTGHYGEGLYRMAVALASASQDVRAAPPSRVHVKGIGVWITILTSAGALAFLWWISRPDLHHPYARLKRGEYWGTGQGGFSGNFGGFGGSTSGEGFK